MNRFGEMAREMERVNRALASARILVAALDQVDHARALLPRVVHSPLRTLLEQAEQSAERVTLYLRETSRS